MPSPGAAAKTSVRSARRRRLEEALLERGDQLLGRAVPTKPEQLDGVAVADQRDGLVGRDDLVLHRAVCACAGARPRCSPAASHRRRAGSRATMSIWSSSISAGAWPQPAISTAAPALRAPPAPRCVISLDRRGEQQVRSSPRRISTGHSTASHTLPQHDVEHHRPREALAIAGIVVQAEAAVSVLHRAVLGEVAPLRVGELRRTARGSRAGAPRPRSMRREAPCSAQVGADALQRGAGDARAEVVEHQAPDRRAGVAPPSPCRCGRRARCRPSRPRSTPRRAISAAIAARYSGVRSRVGDGSHSLRPRPGRSGAIDAHAAFGEAPREEVEVAAVARQRRARRRRCARRCGEPHSV